MDASETGLPAVGTPRELGVNAVERTVGSSHRTGDRERAGRADEDADRTGVRVDGARRAHGRVAEEVHSQPSASDGGEPAVSGATPTGLPPVTPSRPGVTGGAGGDPRTCPSFEQRAAAEP